MRTRKLVTIGIASALVLAGTAATLMESPVRRHAAKLLGNATASIAGKEPGNDAALNRARNAADDTALLAPPEVTQHVEDIADAIISVRDPETLLSPSHVDHPGYDKLGFLYDIAVNALILKAAGREAEARDILDTFDKQLAISTSELELLVDTNNVYGILKLFQPPGGAAQPIKSIVNAIDVTNRKKYGAGQLEFYTTPGPTSFVIFAMAAVDAGRYRESIVILADLILSMQDADGGIRDGDRAPERVHTEPHVDALAALLIAAEITGDERYRQAAERAYLYFLDTVYHPTTGRIDQGMWGKDASEIYATDCYSWTMAGPVGDRLSIDELKRLTRTMLRQGLVKVTVPLPDGSTPTAILIDFSNPRNLRVINARRGFHPMGTLEWTGGVILALQKNAVRLWNAGDMDSARLYKAIAEALLAECMKCFYPLDGIDGKIGFYATGQGIEVAPFGAIQNKSVNGWKVTYFNAEDEAGEPIVKGGSLIAAWPVLPAKRLNPFIMRDNYAKAYDSIPLTEDDARRARNVLTNFTLNRQYTESVASSAPDPSIQIVEPRTFNDKMWGSMVRACAAEREGRPEEARKHYLDAVKWSSVVVDNPVWVKLAQRDNAMKAKEIGGIIFYPWGTSFPNNDHPLHAAIQRYPILNEMGTACWGLATAYEGLGEPEKSKFWIRRIIEEFPLHQIASQGNLPLVTKDTIIGYWNALVSWEENPSGSHCDAEVGELYQEVLLEKGITSAKPKVIKTGIPQ